MRARYCAHHPFLAKTRRARASNSLAWPVRRASDCLTPYDTVQGKMHLADMCRFLQDFSTVCLGSHIKVSASRDRGGDESVTFTF